MRMHRQNIPMHWKTFENHPSMTFAHLLPEIRPAKSDIVIFLEDRTGAAMGFLMVPKMTLPPTILWRWHCYIQLYEAGTVPLYTTIKVRLSNPCTHLSMQEVHMIVSKHSCKIPTGLVFFSGLAMPWKLEISNVKQKLRKTYKIPCAFVQSQT